MRLAYFLPLGALLAIAAAATPTGGDDLPSFQPGLWSFSVTVNQYGEKNPKVHAMTRCADPGTDIRRKWQSLVAQACKFSPVTHTGNQYSYTSSCSTKDGALSMKSVIVADKDDAYRADSVSHTVTRASREVIVARRVGDCPN